MFFKSNLCSLEPQIPYYWAGCKAYDLLAGKENMEGSYLMSKGTALETFPMLKSDGLVGALVYYDGQHNDSRMNMALIMTAVKHGATVANYVEVTDLTKVVCLMSQIFFVDFSAKRSLRTARLLEHL